MDQRTATATASAGECVEAARAIIAAVRRLRSEQGIPAGRVIPSIVVAPAGPEALARLVGAAELVCRAANVAEVRVLPISPR